MNLELALQVFNLQKSDHPDEIHRTYRKLVKRWHPDQFAHLPEIHSQAEEKLKRINQAYGILTDYVKKTNSTPRNSSMNRQNDRSRKNIGKHPSRGAFAFVSGWFRAAFGRDFQTASKSEKIDKTCNRSDSASAKTQTDFDTILRNVCHTRHRGPSSGRRTSRRSRSDIQQYRRRSRSTRIEGFHAASPVTPVKPVRSIDPIESAD